MSHLTNSLYFQSIAEAPLLKIRSPAVPVTGRTESCQQETRHTSQLGQSAPGILHTESEQDAGRKDADIVAKPFLGALNERDPDSFNEQFGRRQDTWSGCEKPSFDLVDGQFASFA